MWHRGKKYSAHQSINQNFHKLSSKFSLVYSANNVLFPHVLGDTFTKFFMFYKLAANKSFGNNTSLVDHLSSKPQVIEHLKITNAQNEFPNCLRNLIADETS